MCRGRSHYQCFFFIKLIPGIKKTSQVFHSEKWRNTRDFLGPWKILGANLSRNGRNSKGNRCKTTKIPQIFPPAAGQKSIKLFDFQIGLKKIQVFRKVKKNTEKNRKQREYRRKKKEETEKGRTPQAYLCKIDNLSSQIVTVFCFKKWILTVS